MFDEKIGALGDDHLAVRCFLAALAAANVDGTLGPVTPLWVRIRLLPTTSATADQAGKAWETIKDAGLVVTWEAEGKTWALLPGWWNHSGRSRKNHRAVKTPDVPADVLDRYPRFADGYLSCIPGKRSQENTTTYAGIPRDSVDSGGSPQNATGRRGVPCSSSSSSAYASTKQASKHPEAGWLACWLLCDADQKIGAEDRILTERAFAHAGGHDVQPETVRKVVEQFDRDAGFARKAVAGLLERSASKPVANFGAYLDSAVTTEIQARNAALAVEAHQAQQREAEAALRDSRPAATDPAAVAKRHEGLWAIGARPKTWETCSCAACEQGRAVPA